jgi:uncharacterized protein (TIRG00374 family)
MEKKTVISYILLIAGFFVLLYMILASKIVDNLDIFTHVNIFLLFLAFSTTLLNVMVKIYRWRYLCKLYGSEIGYHDALRIVVGSFFVSGITPAKVGDIIKAYIMKKRFSMPLLDGVAGILYERVFELLLLFLVSLGVFYVGLSAKNYLIIQVATFIVIFIGIAYIFSDRILSIAQKFLIRTKILSSGCEDLKIRKISPVNALEVFSLTGLALGLEFVRLWLVVLAFGFDMNIIHLSIFFSLAVLIGLLSQIPIGIGVVEGSLAVFLTDAGIPGYYAIGIVLVDRIISMYFVMAIGLIYYKWALKAAMEESG